MDLEFLEAFALHDRKQALEALVPGTEDYYYYHCLFHEHERELSKIDALLATWIERFGRTARAQEIERRRALHDFDRDPEGRGRDFSEDLGLTFDHQREAASAETAHPSRLPESVYERETLKKLVLQRNDATLKGFSDSALDWLADEDLSPERLGKLLDRLRRPDHPRLVELVLQDLGRKEAGFGGRAIHAHLTLAQLEALGKRHPRLFGETKFVSAWLERLRPGEDVDLLSDPKARGEWFARLWGFVKGLDVSFSSLKAHVLHHRLAFERSQGVHDRARFIEYLEMPRHAEYAREEWVSKKEVRDRLVDLSLDFSGSTGLPPVGDDVELVTAFLEHFFVGDDTWEAFSSYVRENFLRRVFATTKLLAGKGDPERWAGMLDDPAALQSLRERVEIELCATNPGHYQADDPVTLEADIKNVPQLIVKVFEINALNHYLVQGGDLDLTVDLDGLVPNQSMSFRYDDPPYRRVRRTFSLPELSRAGVFVVELIGNGRSSRALIEKGGLRLDERRGSAGHVLSVFDDEGRRKKDASAWLKGHEYRPDEDGEITVPFTTRPGYAEVLLKSGDISSVGGFHHRSEDYRLTAGFYVDREQLIAHNEATLLVRPYLFVADSPIEISLFEQARLSVTSEDHSGVSATRVFDGAIFSDERESTFAFQVPENLARLSFELSGKVRSLSLQRDVELSDRTSFEINGVDATHDVESFHLAETAGGWVLFLLGKTGEPRAGQAIRFRFRHRDFTETFAGVVLKTDSGGRVELGHLEDVEWIEAESAMGVKIDWRMPRPLARWPRAVHGQAGSRLPVAYVGPKASLSRSEFALFEKRGGHYVRDAFDALRLEGGRLEAEGLEAGDYELYAKARGQAIVLRLAAGDVLEGFAVSKKRRLELDGQEPLGVRAVEVGKDEIRVALDGVEPDARVHVAATRFLPPHPYFDALGRVHAPDPRAAEMEKARSEQQSGRDIGDEYRYILERKQAKRTVGNMLRRPGLLLNPWAIRPTSTGDQAAMGGGAFAPAAAMKAAHHPAPAAPPPGRAAQTPHPTVDFLPSTSVMLANLVPDGRGVVSIPRSKIGGAMALHVLAISEAQAVEETIRLPEEKIGARDLRLLPGLDPEGHFVMQRRTSSLARGESLDIRDLSTAKLEMFDHLGRVHALFMALTGDATLAEFAFLLDWRKLSEEKRRAKYSEYACHELSFFLSRKDPSFFAQVIAPYLANKRDLTFLDRYLLGHDLSRHLDVWAYGRLNVVERILLGERIPSERARAERHVGDRFELIPPDPEEENRLFRTALLGRALEGGGGAAFSAMGAADAPELEMASGMRTLAGVSKQASLEEVDEEIAEEPVRERELPKKRKKDGGKRKEPRALYRSVEKTEEWAENNYYRRRMSEQTAELIEVNAFWRDYARRDPSRPFLSPHFPKATRSFSEMMLALSVLDLPLEPSEPSTEISGTHLRIEAKAPLLVFHQEIERSPLEKGRSPILVGQSYLRLDDRYSYEGGEQVEKYVTGELLTHVVYASKAVLTNPSGVRQKLEVLLEIPKGALPTGKGTKTKSEHLVLGPYQTHAIEYTFYFPLPGKFTHFPVHVAKNGEAVAAAEPVMLEVVDHPKTVDTKSWSHVSQHADAETVLRWLDEENIERADLDRIAWRMKDRAFWVAAVDRLTKRHVYHATTWSYALFHADRARASEYLRHQEGFLRTAGVDFESTFLRFEPIERVWYEHLEYAPLINARAHRLGPSRRILNDAFADQYRAFLDRMAHRPRPGDADLFEAVHYLLVQDRAGEAEALFRRVDPEALTTRLQHDLLAAYLAFFEAAPDRARKIAERHKRHPVDRWRRLFENVLAQLDEIEGATPSVVDGDDRQQKQNELALSEPALDFEVERGMVKVAHKNLGEARANYYQMDVELLFSRQPFVQQDSERFSIVRPNRSDVVPLGRDRRETSFELPAEYQKSNVLVELVAGAIRRARAVYANRLMVEVSEPYGQLFVRDKESGRPRSASYVKAYARTRSQEVRFHKDGYTDLRGAFDYASLSSGDLGEVERFSVLVVDDALGALIREAAPPRR